MKTRLCRWCSASFEAKAKQQRYCNEDCRVKARRAVEKRHRDKPEYKARRRELRKNNIEDRREKERVYRAQNPKRQIELGWKHAAGVNLTYVEFEALYKKQKGRCAICKRSLPPHGRRGLQPDHCHETGRIRGLICQKCNLGLGMLGDNIAGLKIALRYLEEAEARM